MCLSSKQLWFVAGTLALAVVAAIFITSQFIHHKGIVFSTPQESSRFCPVALIETDRERYSQKDIVKVRIKNQSSRTITFFVNTHLGWYQPFLAERYDETKNMWERVPGSRLKTQEVAMIKIKPGDDYESSLPAESFTIWRNSPIFLPGQFRIIVTSRPDCIIYSSPFYIE